MSSVNEFVFYGKKIRCVVSILYVQMAHKFKRLTHEICTNGLLHELAPEQKIRVGKLR
jgi:hypothetical protein